MQDHILYMHRCLELALLGSGFVAPNPMVGAVLVYEDRIIGEGYHQEYGKAHAEVNCLNNVSEADKQFIPFSTLYVSLEPCAHHGKTPPCADLIIEHKIPQVVIGMKDPFQQVKGKGIEKLKQAGVEVVSGILENECRYLNKRFFVFHTQQRPYIVLKWAQTTNGKIAGFDDKRLLISNEYSNRLVHKWRSEAMGILIGTNTALKDNPELNNRLWTGNNPVRMVVDKQLRLPADLKIFNRQQQTIIFNYVKQETEQNMLYHKISPEKNLVAEILEACYRHNIQSLLIEGGAQLHQSFIDANAWDEANIITNENLYLNAGLAAPHLNNATLINSEHLFGDRIEYYYRSSTEI